MWREGDAYHWRGVGLPRLGRSPNCRSTACEIVSSSSSVFASIFVFPFHFLCFFIFLLIVLALEMPLLATSLVALSLLVLALAVIRYFVVPVPSWF